MVTHRNILDSAVARYWPCFQFVMQNKWMALMDLSEWLVAQFNRVDFPEEEEKALWEAGYYEVIKGPITKEMLDDWLGMIGASSIAEWIEMEKNALSEEELEAGWEKWHQAIEAGKKIEWVNEDPEPLEDAVILAFPSGKRLN